MVYSKPGLGLKVLVRNVRLALNKIQAQARNISTVSQWTITWLWQASALSLGSKKPNTSAVKYSLAKPGLGTGFGSVGVQKAELLPANFLNFEYHFLPLF